MTVREEEHHGKRRWLIDIRYRDEAGKRCRFRKGSTAATKAAAKEEERRIRDFIAKHGKPPLPEAGPNMDLTVQQFGELWTSGKLHKEFPDHVALKKRAKGDGGLLDHHINPVIGNKPIASLTLDDCEAVMKKLKPVKKGVNELAGNTRRNVARCLTRLLNLAVYPKRLRQQSPIPKGWVPKAAKPKAKPYLYPDEDRRLLGHQPIPIHYRILYGFLIREGCRSGEAINARIEDFDLERGTIRLDKNKTDDPRTWSLDPGVVRALNAWVKQHRSKAKPSAPMFVDPEGQPLRIDSLARLLRRHTGQAEITKARPELLERGSNRSRLVVHHLRGTFVTLALAKGATETWVQDRTGHKSSDMIARYRRTARTAEELQLGDLAPLDQAIPELAEAEGHPLDTELAAQ